MEGLAPHSSSSRYPRVFKRLVHSIFPYISKDVALSGVTTKEQAIMIAQQLYLFTYSQSRVIYCILPNTPRAETDPTKPKTRSHADGLIGSMENATSIQVMNQMGQMSLDSHSPAVAKGTASTSGPTQSSYVYRYRKLIRKILSNLV